LHQPLPGETTFALDIAVATILLPGGAGDGAHLVSISRKIYPNSSSK